MKPQVISFRCVVKNSLGQILSSSFSQDMINQKAPEQDRLPGLIDGLQSVKTGETRKITVPADLAYGPYDPSLNLEVPKADVDLQSPLAIGAQIYWAARPGTDPRQYRVVQITRETVVLDANHPLAGQDLTFEVEIVAARDAQPDDFGDTLWTRAGALLH